jgi:hypothetical protein
MEPIQTPSTFDTLRTQGALSHLLIAELDANLGAEAGIDELLDYQEVLRAYGRECPLR